MDGLVMFRPEITIRRAVASDLPAINTLMWESSAYQGQYRSILEGYDLTSAQIERDYVYVAEENARVLGFYSLIAYSPIPELDLLFVSDIAQGFGIGSALVLHLKQLAFSLGIGAVTIVSHPPALDFCMLILTRRVDETIAIGNEISVTVLGVKGN
jgi:GNAT superfamily N-acetyltransferase